MKCWGGKGSGSIASSQLISLFFCCLFCHETDLDWLQCSIKVLLQSNLVYPTKAVFLQKTRFPSSLDEEQSESPKKEEGIWEEPSIRT